MKHLYLYSIVILVITSLLGCDGHRYVQMKIESDLKNKDFKKGTNGEDLYQELGTYLQEYSNKHEFNCFNRETEYTSLLCGGRSITIKLSKKLGDETKVELSIYQVGPLNATKEYEEVRDELLKSVPKLFPNAYVSDVGGAH